MSQVEVLVYVLDFEEVKVLGDYAFEWGTIRGAMRSKDSDEIEHSSYNVMRILKKQADGQWKVHRTIWNDNSAEGLP
jgi:ketosteroid isomerase-like protein